MDFAKKIYKSQDEIKDLISSEQVYIDKYYNTYGNWSIELIKNN